MSHRMVVQAIRVLSKESVSVTHVTKLETGPMSTFVGSKLVPHAMDSCSPLSPMVLSHTFGSMQVYVGYIIVLIFCGVSFLGEMLNHWTHRDPCKEDWQGWT